MKGWGRGEAVQEVCVGAGGRRNSLHPLQAKCDILKTSWKDQMRNGTILQRLDHVLQ